MTVHYLPPRLEKIAELINDSQVMADIGTDHAYLPVSLISRGKTKYAIASDIKPGPLERAQATVNKYNMNDYVSLRLGTGLSSVTLEDMADTIVIAGMGGLIITDILEKNKDIVNNANLIILQPMTKVTEVREYVYNKGFSEIKEYLVKEGDKLYNIISMSPKRVLNETLSDAEKVLGRTLSGSDYFTEYKMRQITKLKKSIEGMRLSKNTQLLHKKEQLLAELTYSQIKEEN